MKPNTDRYMGWSYDVEEVSAGVYRVSATSGDGRKVERTGTEPDKLREECEQAVTQLEHGRVKTPQN